MLFYFFYRHIVDTDIRRYIDTKNYTYKTGNSRDLAYLWSHKAMWKRHWVLLIITLN